MFWNRLTQNWENSIALINKLSLCAIVFFVSSCSFSTKEKHILSHPEWKKENLSLGVKKVVVSFTGNLNGKLTPHKEYIPITEKKLPEFFLVGGAEVLKPYLSIVKKRYKEESILIDSGHIFKKTDAKKKKEYILKLYSDIGYDAITLSDLEFDLFSSPYRNSDLPSSSFLASNIVDLSTGKSLNIGPVLPYKILTKNNVKVGIVGLTNFNKNKKNKTKKVNGIYFEDPVLSFLKVRKVFRKAGVEIVILISHLDTKCKSVGKSLAFSGESKEDNQLECPKDNDPLVTLIKRLPPDSVDLVISGDKTLINGFIDNTPVVQLGGEGQFLGRVDLYYQADQDYIMQEKMKFYSPTKLCHRFFVATEDCHIEIKNSSIKAKRRELMKDTAYQLMDPKFLGHEIKKESLPSSHSL